MTWIDRLQLVALAYFGAVSALKLGLVLRRGVQPMAVGAGKRGLAWCVETALPIAMTLWAWLLIRYSFHLSVGFLSPLLHTPLLDATFAREAGIVILIGAAGLMSLAFLHFGDSWRVGVADPGRLVTHGVFRWSRNPIFLSLDLLCIGALLVNGTLIFLLLAVFTLLGMDYQIRQEESYLRQRFGLEYELYAERTPRYFGRPHTATAAAASG